MLQLFLLRSTSLFIAELSVRPQCLMKGNQEQVAFNAKLDEAIAEAEIQLEEAGPSTSPAPEHAKEALKKGRRIVERKRLIQIAERSEHSWGVVQVYTVDELADDSGDEKRLEKAEKAAKQKAAKRHKKQASSAHGPIVVNDDSCGMHSRPYHNNYVSLHV